MPSDLTIKERQGRKSREKGDTNRGIIFLKIVEKPRSFSELFQALKQDQVLKSSKSLSNHLKNLEKDNMIEKAILHDKVVYKIKIFDTQKVIEELERDFFPAFIFGSILEPLFKIILPDSKFRVQELVTNMAINTIKHGKKVLEKETQEKEIEPVILEELRAEEGEE